MSRVPPSPLPPKSGEGAAPTFLCGDSADFRMMADAAPLLICVAGPDGQATFFNRGWLEFTGRELVQELGDGWANGVHPRDRDRFLKTFHQAFAARRSFQMEYRLRQAAGSYRWVLHRGAPVRQADGAFVGYIGVCIDLTDRWAVEEELRHSREELRQALSAGQMGTWKWDRASGEVRRDPNLCAIYGLGADEKGTYDEWLEVLHPDDRGSILDAVRRSVAEGGAYDLEHRIVRPDGSVRWVELRGQAYWDETGEVVGTRGLVVDITGRKEAEAERSRLLAAEQEARRAATQVAQTLQGSLLPPRIPFIPGIDVAARYHPMELGSEVGGDFYDVFPAGHGRWGVMIGDVSGKGIPAASLTALARYTLRTAAARETSPSAALHVLNRSILDQDLGERFCTIAHAVIEHVDGAVRMTLSCAGHPPPLLQGTDGTVQPLGRAGTAVGMFSELSLVDDLATLGPGEVVVFYTDGLVEARTPDGAFADGLLEELLATMAGASADAIAVALEQALLDVQGGRPRDDMALLVLRAPSEVFHRSLTPEPAKVSSTRASLAEWLAPRLPAADDDLRQDLLLVVSELLTNAVRVAEGDVHLHLWIEGGEIVVDVYDDGSGFDASVPPSAVVPDALAGRGRGLFIVRSLMDDCRVQSGPSGTLVRCRRKVRSGPG